MLIASCRTTVAVFTVFFLLELAFLTLTIGALGYATLSSLRAFFSFLVVFLFFFPYRNVDNATKAGGWIGILTAVAAWYASAAFVINNTW